MPEQKPYKTAHHGLPERSRDQFYTRPFHGDIYGRGKSSCWMLRAGPASVVIAAELEFQAVRRLGRDRRQSGAGECGSTSRTSRQPQLSLKPSILGGRSLQISYFGILNDTTSRFLSQHLQRPRRREKTLASTQFESTDARRAFPCWDEPEFKAVFPGDSGDGPSLDGDLQRAGSSRDSIRAPAKK